VKDLRILPKVRDSWSYHYVEHARVDQEEKGICQVDATGRIHIPCASLSLLMLGPGTTVTHAAVSTLADSGCLVAWCGEQGVRFYAQGMGETRSAANLLQQAHLAIVRRMYAMRFPEPLEPHLTLRQIRGKEGARVRAAYAKAAEAFSINWGGRTYNRQDWDQADPVNRALSAANSCLYGVTHAAIVAAGYSPALGFVHTGKMLSFVYDVADLYKMEATVPVAFQEAAAGGRNLESRVRHRCREQFQTARLLDRIVADLEALLAVPPEWELASFYDSDEAAPGDLWDPSGSVTGGRNFEGER
jgi:CRISPR-associated protein Cas1